MTPSDVQEKEKAPGVQGGGAEIRVRVGGTRTLVREEPDDPQVAPPPTIIGEELCPAEKVYGQFEPAQGTWQDDPTFEDRPGKRIVRMSPVLLHAELKMVTNRYTLLHGVERAVGGSEPSRDEIFLKGEAAGTPIPVKFRFTLQQGSNRKTIGESEIVGEAPVGGRCGPTLKEFRVALDVKDGFPDFYFRFEEDGSYLIEAELITEDGRETGIKATVIGESVSTRRPSLAFRLVTIRTTDVERALPIETDLLSPNPTDVELEVMDLAYESSTRIPDFFPLENRGLSTRVFPLRDRSDLLQGDLFEILEHRAGLGKSDLTLGPQLIRGHLREALREEIIREMQVGNLMSGFDRTVVLNTDADFRMIWMGSLTLEPDAVAFAPSQKVVFVNLDVSGDPYTVAHEIIHTLPFSFAEEEMLAECGLNYHGNAATNVAHGHMVSFRGRQRRDRRDGSPQIMGASAKDVSQWISQCSYWHVLEVLRQGIPDPRVLLVQGYVVKDVDRSDGFFLPFYDLDGVEDLPTSGTGSWAIVLRDRTGRVLARHPWEPAWRIPHLRNERKVVAFAYRLVWPEGLASVDLEGPRGLLESRTLSAAAPTVAILVPAAGAPIRVGDGGVRVEWAGTDADGDPLLYTVLYSSDAGGTWIDAVVETDQTAVRVPIDREAPPDAHRVLVRATDGGRSADATVAFRPEE